MEIKLDIQLVWSSQRSSPSATLLWLPLCLLPSANPTFTGAMTKFLYFHSGFCCTSGQDHYSFYHMLLTTDQMYVSFIWAIILVKAGKVPK